MKRILSLLSATFAGVVLVAAGPEIRWLSQSHHFGAFDESAGPASYDFRFVNTGDQPLTVISARASCGCTTPLIPSGPVAPGDTASVSVAYNPAGRPGRFNKSVSVETDAVNMPKTKLTVSGVVIGSPASVAGQYPVDKGALRFNKGVIMFGQVDRPRLKTVFTNAYNLSADSITPRVAGSPRYIDFAFEPKTVGPGEQITLIAYLRSSEVPEWGLVEDSLTIVAGADRFILPFTATIREDFSGLSDDERRNAPVARLSDTGIDFGLLSGTDTLTRTVSLTNRGKSPLEIRRLYTTDPGVSVSVEHTTVKKGHTATITVTVDPTKVTARPLNGRITLITNDPLSPTQVLRAVAE